MSFMVSFLVLVWVLVLGLVWILILEEEIIIDA